MAEYQLCYVAVIANAGAAIAPVLSMSSIPSFAGLLSRSFAGLLSRCRGEAVDRPWWVG